MIATFRGEALGNPYTMFDFAPVGLVVAVVGIAYVALIGWRLIPVERTSASMPSSIEDLESYLVELRVTAEAEVIGQKLRQLDDQAGEAGVQILGLVRDGERLPGMRPAPLWKPMTASWSKAAPMASRLSRAWWRSATLTPTDPPKRSRAPP